MSDSTGIISDAASRYIAGDLDGAEQSCRATLDANGDAAAALDMMGTIRRQRGRYDEALAYSRRAVAIEPDCALFRFNLGECYRSTGRLDEAVLGYHHALRSSKMPQTYRALGQTYALMRRFPQAADAFAHSIELDPENLYAHQCLVACLMGQGNWAGAVEAARRGISHAPADRALHRALGDALAKLGEMESAVESWQKFSGLRPDRVAAQIDLALVLNMAGLWEEGAAAAQRALSLDPSSSAARSQLAGALRRLGHITAAGCELRQILDGAPQQSETMVLLAGIEMERMNHAEAMRLVRHAAAVSNDSELIHGNVLSAANYDPDCDELLLLDEHRYWATRLLFRTKQRTPPEPSEPEHILRIGYVSPDLRSHPVSSFLEPILSAHNRSRFIPVVFSDVLHPDAVTARLRNAAAEWHDTTRMNHGQFADFVMREHIDILVDLAGHTTFNRLPAFALRAAPVQVTYLGYPNTTGLPAHVMHYRITDHHCDPRGTSDQMHTERLARLPDCFLCYGPPEQAPEIGILPADSSGFVTFGCFAHARKLSHRAIDLWIELLTDRCAMKFKLSGVPIQPVRRTTERAMVCV